MLLPQELTAVAACDTERMDKHTEIQTHTSGIPQPPPAARGLAKQLEHPR